ncbi:acylphosphatase [Streptococcus azizii]|uniref:acylphosphatase n=1 Tax=Streptococcus azizii TaxID=1579424 RepID=A0AB36JSR6_9STRE|nr:MULTISPECIES: acylphosphatase [Streptococcus]MBF0775339.1 acylphosphatase [Streptococcus sp. 19428wD3_AN2]ONK29610.1 acylphosphatase [Streptococcus azizii]ONK30119.1 acylphosphatase [Streptococcus azizii]ONK30894.1 acylphosphatase [Streptococcus azizii]TFU84864.1 acylphosphatase [Streptococcus sp. AN2]
MQKVKMIASGRVQGVGFRWAVQYLAIEIGNIYGRVWNNADGTVTILAQSEKPAKLSQFIQEIRKGPSRMSKVTYLDVSLANFETFKDFRVKQWH